MLHIPVSQHKITNTNKTWATNINNSLAKQTHTYTHTYTHTLTHTHLHTHALTHTRTYTRTHTHAHTHTPSICQCVSGGMSAILIFTYRSNVTIKQSTLKATWSITLMPLTWMEEMLFNSKLTKACVNILQVYNDWMFVVMRQCCVF